MVTVESIKALLNGHHGAMFASLKTRTAVKTAAKYKQLDIQKISSCNIQIFASIANARAVYEQAVIRSAQKLNQDIDFFESSETWYFHDTECYSVIYHKLSLAPSLWARYLHSRSEYYIDGQVSDKDSIIQYLTPSDAKQLLDTSGIVHNKTNNVDHNIIIRTPKLESIIELKARHDIITS